MTRNSTICAIAILCPGAYADRAIGRNGAIGVNVLLNRPVTEAILADFVSFGTVLDLLPEINGLTLRAREFQLATIRALPYVAYAGPDVECQLAACDPLSVSDLTAGASEWCLDAINVMDAGGDRTLEYDGEGVYVAVIDTGLPFNWCSYFPQERIADQFARGFVGGGGMAHAISSQPELWEHDTDGHGATVTCEILGFAYSGPDEELPRYFNGVAPRATVIPINIQGNGQGYHSGRWESLTAHAFVYVTNLKVSGALGDAPLVINLSQGIHQPLPMMRAAINYAIDNGVIVVVAAGNEADAGMRYPGAYSEVISVAAMSWVGQFPADDPTTYRWMLNDVPENDASQHLIAPFSSRELPGQELDLAAPGFPVPVPHTIDGRADYTFTGGTSQAAPHVVGVVALMLQKNPGLTQVQVEAILESSALPLPSGCANIRWPNIDFGAGDQPTWEDHNNVSFFDLTTCWEPNATGAGLLQADAALAATPLP